MPLYKTSDEWQHFTSLLLQARPTTTRITTKYTLPPTPSKSKLEKLKAKRAAHLARKPDGLTTDNKDAADRPGRAYIELKTYDPESGVVLKYRTDKAAEVGRLIGSLGRMGRIMAALPADDGEDVVMGDAAGEDGPEVGESDKVAPPAAAAGQPSSGGGGGGTKKKKKGKR